MEFLIFSVFAVVSVGAALLMVLQRNAMYSALFLVLIFFCLAVFYILLGAYFLAVVQVAVYAGAIMVLFIFVIMLLAADTPSIDLARTPVVFKAGAVAMGFALLVLLTVAIHKSPLTAPQGMYTAEKVQALEIGRAHV